MTFQYITFDVKHPVVMEERGQCGPPWSESNQERSETRAKEESLATMRGSPKNKKMKKIHWQP